MLHTNPFSRSYCGMGGMTLQMCDGSMAAYCNKCLMVNYQLYKPLGPEIAYYLKIKRGHDPSVCKRKLGAA